MLKIALPTGRMLENIRKLLEACGWEIDIETRSYRPTCNQPGIELKLLKPQNIATMVELGSHDAGFTGYDWIVESQANVKEVLDVGFDPVRIVVAAPRAALPLLKGAAQKPLIVATEYVHIAQSYFRRRGIPATIVRTFGTTEVYPPEDADAIVDNTSTGTTLRKNRLFIADTIMHSSTRFIAHRHSMNDRRKRDAINDLALVMTSILRARRKVLIEMNADNASFAQIIKHLPAMKAPTVAPLYGGAGYAITIAVDKNDVPRLLVQLKKQGATDILVSEIRKIIP